MKKQKSYSSEFKFKVALEMIKGDLTIAEIISKYEVPRSVLGRWKKEFLEKGAMIFQSSKSQFNKGDNPQIDKLHETIGRLKVENDFLHQISNKLNL